MYILFKMMVFGDNDPADINENTLFDRQLGA
jgi:hypothetical protein